MTNQSAVLGRINLLRGGKKATAVHDRSVSLVSKILKCRFLIQTSTEPSRNWNAPSGDSSVLVSKQCKQDLQHVWECFSCDR